MNAPWLEGNDVRLLINGNDYYRRVFDSIGQARQRVLLETFIIQDDAVGKALQQVLVEAARRGVQIDVTVDGYGTADLPPAFIQALTSAGVRLHVFDPQPRWMGMRTNLFRRLHRKLVVIDGQRAFVGGLNYGADHLDESGPMAKQDYAVEVTGPVVAQVQACCLRLLGQEPPEQRAAPDGRLRGQAWARLLDRDNQHHTNTIEEQYLAALQAARFRVLIANAYFFPGYRLLRELRNAARRGVEVTLILQGQPDLRWVRALSRLLYNHLLRDGVRVLEYCRRPLHGKVALVDDQWATVGSSNLDPLSLALNLEANLFIRDDVFNKHLHDHLQQLIRHDCKRITLERMVRGFWWRAPLIFLCFHCIRHFPTIAGWLPAHKQYLRPLAPHAQPISCQEGER
ncbi:MULTISPECIES: cardiolipin synthase ClsB [Pseudomonas]|uniref:cardiolipin synthase ClsB n=1 Tax=Pseudomonas TaxID=286 RepID=UPI0006B46EC8|nr:MULTISPECIES: cardiolipin synthase ClsB [Pseudomonas]KPA99192.1 phosphatidylserine/phosphatidylglycerophosphate/cardiolipin synthase [Pseudomonas fuscovaginae]